MPDQNPTDELLQSLERQLKYWSQSTQQLEKAFQTVSDSELPATIQAYDTVTRRERETREEIARLKAQKHQVPIVEPQSFSGSY